MSPRHRPGSIKGDAVSPHPPAAHPKPWTKEPPALAHSLGADLISGLSAVRALQRLAAEGRNELRGRRGPGPLALFLRQFKQVVIWVLVGAAVLSAFLGDLTDAAAIGAIVLLNAFIGFYQEYRAEKSVAALRSLAAPLCRVLRDGRAAVIPAAEVVRGDVLLLDAGDLVAADARLFASASLRVNEAPLTGESEPVEKDAEPIEPEEAPLAERRNMAYQGTAVVGGTARALVTATGMQTEVGRITTLLNTAHEDQTPLQRRLDQVGRRLLVASLAVVALVFLLGVMRGEPGWEMLLTAVSLAVAAVPEGLPAVVTVALSLGVGRMARRHALIRRLPAVETLGSAQVICTDKTGTLTMGQMTTRLLWVGGREIELTGEGYDSRGLLLEAGRPLDACSDPALHTVLSLVAGCSEASLDGRDGTRTITGDPTEAALLVAAAKAGIHREAIEAECPRLRLLPFDSDRKRMAIIRRTPHGVRAFVKGAPDLLLTRCTQFLEAGGSVRPLTDSDRREIAAAADFFAARALRVLAAAFRDLPEADATTLPGDRIETRLVFSGLFAMYDPPRPEAREAVRRCREAGIRVVMITGDHPSTAAAVAGELGILAPGDTVLSGIQVAHLNDQELAEQAAHAAVYARVTAEDKLRIVRAFKSRGLVAAMTGDGVNDAPAIREASIGVAMGISGAEVTKEASDMVITDDNFSSIVAAVEEGRGIYDNIKKCLQYLLSGNVAEILVMLAAVLAGWPIPLLPLQLLWINLVTDGLPALALATDPVDPGVLRRPPRRPGEELTDGASLRLIFLTGALTAGAALLAFHYGLVLEQSLTAARSYAFSTLVFAEVLRSFGVRSPDRPLWKRSGPGNRYLTLVVAASIVLQVSLPHAPALRRLFGVEPLSITTCLGLLLLGMMPLLILEGRKALLARSLSRRTRTAA